MKVNQLREGLESLWESVTDGWERLRRTAASALTRYRPGDSSNLPAPSQIDDAGWMPDMSWAMVGGDVYEDERRVIVRLEAPGLEKQDFDIEVRGDRLTVRGEKRFERESDDGRWRVLQCAYGRFERRVPLPAKVRADDARASYRNGVLRIELPKANPGGPRRIDVSVR